MNDDIELSARDFELRKALHDEIKERRSRLRRLLPAFVLKAKTDADWMNELANGHSVAQGD